MDISQDYDNDGNNIVPCPICLDKYCPSKEGGKCPEEDNYKRAVETKDATDPITASRERMVQEMVQRFLGWKLPSDFSPDGGITFEPEFNVEYMAKQGKQPMRREPTGTNLFTADQAEAMVRFILDDLAVQHEAVVRREMAQLVCPQCAGRCPPYQKLVSGPNTAGNYTHKRKDGGAEVLCSATLIHSVARYSARTTKPSI